MPEVFPSNSEARAYARDFELVPVRRRLEHPGLEPVEAFRRLREPGGLAFLLESGDIPGRQGRYSYIGFAPRGLGASEAELLDILARVGGQEHAPVAGVPPFVGGCVGYLGYEMVRCFERVPLAAGDGPPMLPAAFVRVEDLAVFDRLDGSLDLLTIHRPRTEDYDAALARLEGMAARLATTPPGDEQPDSNPDSWRSNTSPQAYEEMVEAAKEHIFAGDIFQVVLSQRFAKKLGVGALPVYQAMARINPSPYMFLLDFGEGGQLVGTSPELLVRVEGSRVETRPLAGTRPRGATPVEDRQMEADLLRDPKEMAEHVMLVDLGRNDVGRIAKPGSVHVESFAAVERYSHVMHISSSVSAELDASVSTLDVLRATFPAGTVSGAPKIRAMEIISELEPEGRGPYAGAVGYIGYGGNLDMAITLRTIVIAGGVAYIQAGAGVVADSIPEREYRETLAKAGVMFDAVAAAEAGR